MVHNDFDIFTPRIKHDLCKGCLLIAEPFLNEPYFTRSIILLTEYDSEGSMGFVLNKPSKLYPDEILEPLNSFHDPLFLGGPVSTDCLYFVHTLGDTIRDSNYVGSGLWWGGNHEDLWEVLNNGTADNSQVRFFSGYAGWTGGQLESEIERHSWVVAPLDTKIVFASPQTETWGRSMRNLGDVYSIWANFPQHPQFN